MKPELLMFSLGSTVAAGILGGVVLCMKGVLAKRGSYANSAGFLKDYGIPMCGGLAIICLIFAAITLYLGLGFKL